MSLLKKLNLEYDRFVEIGEETKAIIEESAGAF